VWGAYHPAAAFQRMFFHNYVINIRPHGVGAALNCYADGKARAIWLDEGAPQVAVMPNLDLKVRGTDGVIRTV
jgi:hypothetical protein